MKNKKYVVSIYLFDTIVDEVKVSAPNEDKAKEIGWNLFLHACTSTVRLSANN